MYKLIPTLKNMNKVTIFYETSEGKMTQWSGILVSVKSHQITILRHKQEMNFVFDNTNFLLVTENHVKDLGLSERPSELFSNELRDNLVDTFKDNVQLLWLNSKLVVQKAKAPH